MDNEERTEEADLSIADKLATEEALDGVAGRRLTTEELERLERSIDNPSDPTKGKRQRIIDAMKKRAGSPERMKRFLAKRRADKQAAYDEVIAKTEENSQE